MAAKRKAGKKKGAKAKKARRAKAKKAAMVVGEKRKGGMKRGNGWPH